LPLIRRLPIVLLALAASVAPPVLRADAIASVTVESSLPGTTPCRLTSSGAAIQCVSGNIQTPPDAVATGNASAGVGSLSLSVTAASTGGSATASAIASYNYELFFPGAASGNITGEYAVSGSAAGDIGIFGNISLAQGSSSVTFPIEAPAARIPNPVTISSAYVSGQPLVISGNMGAEASTPGEETASGSVRLIGFFDQAGNSIPFTVAPEPATWPVLGLCLLVLGWRGKRIR